MALLLSDAVFNRKLYKKNNNMKKYKHKQTGDVAIFKNSKYEVENLGVIIPNRYIENSNDWELIQSIEVGNIYKQDGLFILIKEKNENFEKVKAIGFDFDAKWTELKEFYLCFNTLTEATKEEWFERLKEEAIKRGLVEGVKFKSAYSGVPGTILNYFCDKLCLLTSDGYLMDSETGKWATVIEEKPLTGTGRLSSQKIHNDAVGTSYSIKLEPIRKHNYSIKAPTINIGSTHVVKKPILTTHDGVELFDGNEAWGAAIQASCNDVLIKCRVPFDRYSQRNNRVWFSTKEKAQEYINLNRKIYSLNDINEALNNLKDK